MFHTVENAILMKDILLDGLREMIINQSILNSYGYGGSSERNPELHNMQPNCVLGKSVKYAIAEVLKDEINSRTENLSEVNVATWQIDTHNIAKSIMETSQMVYFKQNLSSTLEICAGEIEKEIPELCFDLVSQQSSDCSNLTPLLQPHQYKEVASSISRNKPLQSRLQAFQLLILSQLTDAVTMPNWHYLQNQLQENLSDDNLEVFHLCLQTHAKLISCSSSEAIKESFLNLLESLCNQFQSRKTKYYDLDVSNYDIYRMVHTSSLILDAIKEACHTVARFGSKRLEDMIGNLIDLLSVHGGRYVDCLSPFSVISCLDPKAEWSIYLAHSTISRSILLSSLSHNTAFIRIVVQEIVMWFKNPYNPKLNNLGESLINFDVSKYAMFCQSFSFFVEICKYEHARRLFPVVLSKDAEPITIQSITKMVITFFISFGEGQIGNGISKEFTISLEKLLMLRENQTPHLLEFFFRAFKVNPIPLHAIQILDTITKHESFVVPLLKLPSKKRNVTFSELLLEVPNLSSTGKQKDPHVFLDRQTSLPDSVADSSSNFCPRKIIINVVVNLLKAKEIDLNRLSHLLAVCRRLLSCHEGASMLEISNSNLIQSVVAFYSQLLHVSEGGNNIAATENNVALISLLHEFLWNIACTPLGHFLVYEQDSEWVLKYGLQGPEIPWADPKWCLTVSFAMNNTNSSRVITIENHHLVRSQLLKLWELIDDHTASDHEVNDMILQLIGIFACFGTHLPGVIALFSDESDVDGSYETLTDLTFVRPTTLPDLIHQCAISFDCMDNFNVHQFALTILRLITSNLDSCLYLQNKLQFKERLEKMQTESKTEGGEVITDECSMLQTEVLAHCVVPGPGVGAATKGLQSLRTSNSELERWLHETRGGVHDMGWLRQAKRAFRATHIEEFKFTTVVELAEQVQWCVEASAEFNANSLLKWESIRAVDSVALFPEEILGVEMVIRYGAEQKLLQRTNEMKDNLSQVLKICKATWPEQEKFAGFDWFMATGFLLNAGNVNKCLDFLSCFMSLPSSAYAWPAYAQFLELIQSSAIFGHLLESLVSSELPLVFQALQSNGISWWLVCRQRIAECFWSTLDWPQVVHWLAFVILHPPDHLIYFCVSLLHHDETTILTAAVNKQLWNYIMMPLESYKLSDHFSYMDKLCKRHQTVILPQLLPYKL